MHSHLKINLGINIFCREATIGFQILTIYVADSLNVFVLFCFDFCFFFAVQIFALRFPNRQSIFVILYFLSFLKFK